MGFFGVGGGAAGIGGSTGATDNAILRADGAGGASLQNSALIVEDPVATFAVTGVASTDVFTAVGHNFTTNQAVVFSDIVGGTGIVVTTTIYFVRDISGDTFKVSTSSGGSAINFTTDLTAGFISSFQPSVSIVNNHDTTNSFVHITPKGNGGFALGPKPDNTTTGGRPRGAYAVDLQIPRTSSVHVASGLRSIILAGENNTASGSNAIVGGNNSSATVNNSVAIGGSSQCSATGSFALGSNAICDRRMIVFAAGIHTGGAAGDSQIFTAILRAKTTTNSAVELLIAGTDRLTVPSGKVMSLLINIQGIKSDGSAVANYVRQCTLKNVAGTTSEVYAAVTVGADNAAGTSISVTANDTNDAVNISATGVASETWRWTARVDGLEQAYGS